MYEYVIKMQKVNFDFVLYKSSRKLNSIFYSHHYHVIFRRVTCRIVYRMQTFKRIVKWRALLIRRCKEIFFVSRETKKCSRIALNIVAKEEACHLKISRFFLNLSDILWIKRPWNERRNEMESWFFFKTVSSINPWTNTKQCQPHLKKNLLFTGARTKMANQ